MPSRTVVLWLVSVCTLIVCMILLGGITRITGSGLSIVDWSPIMGAIPPLSESDWQKAFAAYQGSPQFRMINSSMSLPDFKFIFFWEYFHRLVGRLLGIVFFLPWLGLTLTRKIDRSLSRRLLIAFLLGGLQGALGWFMVKSGLVDRPYVSHFRLAAHLSLALALLSYIFLILLDVLSAGRPKTTCTPVSTLILTGLVCLQLIYGAFVAGLKAGYAYPTFPKMMGSWIPEEAFSMTPAWMNALSNPAMVQFVHRWIGTGIVMLAIALYLRDRRAPYAAIAAVASLQFILGVSTLVLSVPLPLAAAHQLVGSCLLLTCLWAMHSLARRDRAPAQSQDPAGFFAP